MPISRDDFERGRTEDSDEDKVTQFLNGNPGTAYTSEEIAEAIGHTSAKEPPEELDKNRADLQEMIQSTKRLIFDYYLQSLASEGKISTRVIQTGSGSVFYYTARP